LPLAAAGKVGSSDLREDATDGGRLRVRRVVGATAAAALMKLGRGVVSGNAGGERSLVVHCLVGEDRGARFLG
jgi:hypothetical protein